MIDLLPADIAPAERRGGGAGGTGGAPGSPGPVAKDTILAPFQVGAGGLVVVIIPAHLKAACARRGWSLAELARRAGISYPTLKSILQGQPVRPRTAWKLARSLSEGSAFSELDRLVGAS